MKKMFFFIVPLLLLVFINGCTKHDSLNPVAATPTSGNEELIKEAQVWYKQNFPNDLPNPFVHGTSDLIIKNKNVFQIPDWTDAKSFKIGQDSVGFLKVPLGDVFYTSQQQWVTRDLICYKDSGNIMRAMISELRLDTGYLNKRSKLLNKVNYNLRDVIDANDFTGDWILYTTEYKILSGVLIDNGAWINNLGAKPKAGNMSVTAMLAPMKPQLPEVDYYGTLPGNGFMPLPGRNPYMFDRYNSDNLLSGDGASRGSSTATNMQDPGANFQFYYGGDDASKITDLQKFFSCFNTIPDNGAKYSVTVCVRLANPDDPKAILSGTTPGHVFITLKKANGSNSISQSFGFFPQSVVLAMSAGAVTSKTNDNGGSRYNASLTTDDLSALDFKTIQNMAAYLSNNMKYDVDDYNCTHYALQVFNSIRSNPLKVPDWIVPQSGTNYKTIPNGLYKLLGDMKGSNSVNIGSSTAPISSHCQ